jgi:hypothetical protein
MGELRVYPWACPEAIIKNLVLFVIVARDYRDSGVVLSKIHGSMDVSVDMASIFHSETTTTTMALAYEAGDLDSFLLTRRRPLKGTEAIASAY